MIDEVRSEFKFFAVKVRALRETEIADDLRQKGFAVLAPTYVEHRRYSDRIRKLDSALFPGYLFVSMDPKELLPLVTTVGVSYIVKSGNVLTPISDTEVLTIKTLCETKDRCEPWLGMKVGQKVCIESGPFAGLEGVLTRVGENARVVLSVDTIFQSVSVDVRDTKVTILK